ncbi:hypothetical protein OH809_26925 [Streptomyces sp. NBC_00873]|uniref:hypothetical protein n=1 Tax=unclassified Streptomyces TaxID=2593676 RepID=UPI00386303B8|nr:hypothetical protein OH809_26925 [Streptomyces sp. NBC_00873]WTA44061.1 hypothetical protein OH821_16750 [Streptomyces sp. NBC_00842]
MKATLRWAVCAVLVATGATACGDDETGTEQPKVLSASQVCDGSLGPSGAAALKRVSTTDRFTELDGTNEIGDPNAFSLPLAAKRLHDDLSDRNLCQPYKADNDSDFPVLRIDFEARASHSDPKKVATKGADDLVVYPLGEFAVTHEDGGATLVFACPTEGGGESTPYVRANLTVTRGQIAPDSMEKDQMAVLNGVSRALAEELGCAAQAKLPAEVPDALAAAG